MPIPSLIPLLDTLIASVFVVDADRQVVFANQAARKQFGARLTGMDFVRVIRDPECLKALDKVLAGKKKNRIVITLQNPVRTTFQVNIARLGAKEKKGSRAARAVISLENISHIREAEAMRSEFVANVSHELRSPLTSLNGFIQTLKGSARDDAEARDRFLGIMEHEASRMNRLIEDLLTLSKVEADEHIRPDASVDVLHLMERVIETVGPLARKDNVRIRLTTPRNLQTCVPADEDQLMQVFLNLVENAIKYGGPDQKVEISIANRERAPGVRGPALVVEVVDHGPGIQPEHLPRLTERFYRVDTGRSRKKGGTGLGLAIVKHILARHRGRLQIASTPGQGSTFRVFLPLQAPS